MRKFLRKFFWSHGAPLGYLGSLSQKGHPEIFSKWVLINLSNPLRHPVPLVDPLLTKNLDTAGPWCVEIRPDTGLRSSILWNRGNRFPRATLYDSLTLTVRTPQAQLGWGKILIALTIGWPSGPQTPLLPWRASTPRAPS